MGEEKTNQQSDAAPKDRDPLETPSTADIYGKTNKDNPFLPRDEDTDESPQAQDEVIFCCLAGGGGGALSVLSEFHIRAVY